MARKLHLAMAMAAALSCGAAQAATYTWTPTTGGSYGWNSSANWNPNSAFPNAATDVANVTAGLTGNQNISLFEPISIATLNLGSGTANGDGGNSYTIGGNANALTMSNGTITENAGGSGDTIASAINASGTLTITNNAANTGGHSNALTLSGAVADTTTGQLDYNGSNASEVTTLDSASFSGGGQLNASGGGVLKLDGSMTFSYVQAINGATINLTGGSLTNTGNTSMQSGAGAITVSGGTFHAGAGSVYIGNGPNTGTLTVTGTGIFTNTNAIGVNGGAVNVSGAGTINASVMTLASSGETALMTQTGGTVNYYNPGGGPFVIGNGGTAVYNISAGTFHDTGNSGIFMGLGGGNGTMTISGTGTVNLSAGLLNVKLGWSKNGTGVINLEGGTLETYGTVYSGSGTYSGTSATFKFTGGVLAVGYFNATGIHDGTVLNPTGVLTNQGGTVAPGELGAVGTTAVTGNYAVTSNTAALAIDIASATTYDKLTVSGTTSLGGLLQVDMLAGFMPSLSNTYTILTSTGSLSGAFANVAFGSRLNVTDYGSPNIIGSFEVIQSGNNVELTNFGAAVPEPATLGLMGLAGLGILLLPRRKRVG